MAGANVFSNGTVYQAKLGNLRTMLNFDLTKFPFDRQTFEIKMQSWSDPVDELNFTLNEKPFIRHEYHYFTHIEWELEYLEAELSSREFGELYL